MKRILIIALIAFAAIGIAGAWPMENGAVQLSKISFDEIKQMDTGMTGDLASVGMTKEHGKVLDITGQGTGLGKNATKNATIGMIWKGR